MRSTIATKHDPDQVPAGLRRSLNLPLAVLFGLGVTVGAGIYVLIGATAGRAGMHAPVSFLLAALVMAPTAASFAEFASRMPVSAGEAAYVNLGFQSRWLARLVGLMVITVGVFSAAAIAKGSAGYLREFVDLPPVVLAAAIVLAMGAVAVWGIVQSVAVAGLMTLVELAGLLVVVGFGITHSPQLLARAPEVFLGLGQPSAMAGVLSASLLAFFAFIGFEGLANIAEEVKAPQKTLPRAIFLTLAISTLLYTMVVWVALVSVPGAELATARAPLSLVFQRVTGASSAVISGIAIVATANGLIALMVMAARVIYGMADRQMLPAMLARVDPLTRTPLLATGVVCAAVLVLVVAFPLEGLAQATSGLTLVIFALVNAALVRLKWRRDAVPAGSFVVPMPVPVAGCALCLLLLVAAVIA